MFILKTVGMPFWYDLLENSLIQEKYLTEISKNGYTELLKKASRKEIEPEFFEKLKSDLGFDPYLLFPINSHLSCYGYSKAIFNGFPTSYFAKILEKIISKKITGILHVSGIKITNTHC